MTTDARYRVIERCLDCNIECRPRNHIKLVDLGRIYIPLDCPLPRMADIPEVKALVAAMRLANTALDKCWRGDAMDILNAAIAALEEK
jgi:hypothetical protein